MALTSGTCAGVQFVSPVMQAMGGLGSVVVMGGMNSSCAMLQSQPLLLHLPHQQQQFQPQQAMLLQNMQLQHLQQCRERTSGQARRVPSDLELAAAVESLYLDGLCPYGRILRKRLLELTEVLGFGSLELDLKELRSACRACAYLEVKDAESESDWSAVLLGRPAQFVDVYSPEDAYSAEMWAQAERYFSTLPSGASLPGGRFACAQVLVQRRLPWLAGYSLGQVCHIVQIAISQRKLLGYTNGTLVPYNRSESKKKAVSALNQHPCPGKSSRRSTVVTWDTLRSCLRSLLEPSAGRSPRIPLSNIKRVFRSQFQVELSETALGYAKLSELFQDSRLDGVCVTSQTHLGHVISAPVAATAIAALPAAAQKTTGTSDLRRRSLRVSPLSMELIEDAAAPPLPSPAAATPVATAGRLLSAPTPNKGAVAALLPTLLCSLHGPPRGGGSRPTSHADPGKKLAGARPAASPAHLPQDSEIRLSVRNTFIHFAVAPPTPLALLARGRARSLPRDG